MIQQTRTQHQNAYSLIEIVCVIAISTAVMGLITRLLVQQFASEAYLYQTVDHIQTIRRLSQTFRNDVFQAEKIRRLEVEESTSNEIHLSRANHLVLYKTKNVTLVRHEYDTYQKLINTQEFKFPLYTRINLTFDEKTQKTSCEFELPTGLILGVKPKSNIIPATEKLVILSYPNRSLNPAVSSD